MEGAQLLFLDFEFTMPESKRKPHGFYPEIIEVGAVFVQEDVQDTFSSYVKPTRFPLLTERCKSFLNVSQEDIDGGISFLELMVKLRQYEGATLITWGNMDVRVLRQNCEAAGIVYPFQTHRDLSLEYKHFFGDRNQTGLWKAIESYGKKGTGKHHRALDDALTTYNIFKLVEKDKQYLVKPAPPTIGDRVDFSKLLKRVSTN
ncbi:3'-5' exonuclease KapD [Ectobacillus antri]|jgi:sporulation inhibitor KapD|uniref:3'-5' exonuclease KapD n=1 Tax=Ectobacillus antri TaxID=2486280 RepID=A0ABT6H8Q5_9BACI|nr:3'-5' exonuclease KapD [Ectobacillus antri]MDG4658272.1 3'-5' exonuclease KapD [Ectobacillus antri]MDG5755347.1 3'-5' exonuclease KapD [Ectobacillus antri]